MTACVACFRLSQEGGSTLVTDPYDPTVIAHACKADRKKFDYGLQADTVIVSSLTDEAHAYYQAVEGNPQLINALDVAQGQAEAKIEGERLVAVQAAEAPHHPEGPDDNALYAFTFGGVKFLHMGDLGYGIFEDELAPFAGRCEVLLALTGEHLTLGLDDLDRMIDILKPKWIVPMHYALPPLATPEMTKVEPFLKRRVRDPVVHVRSHAVTFPLPVVEKRRPTIVVLEPSGYESAPGELF